MYLPSQLIRDELITLAHFRRSTTMHKVFVRSLHRY